MKKILSSILAAATLATIAVWPASAESYTKEVQVPYLSNRPEFDGEINADEWGEKSFTVSGRTAAKPGDETPSEENTFAHYPYEYDESINKPVLDDDGNLIEDEELKAQMDLCSYDVWLRWDTKYLYIAAKVNDPDGYYKTTGFSDIWNGDCVQFRVDPMGPNSYQSYKNPNYDYKTEAFDIKAAATTNYQPWAYGSKICNIGMGTTQRDVPQVYDMVTGGTGNMTGALQLNDNAKRLGPEGTLSGGVDMESLFGMKITPSDDGSSVNTYECAVPWAYLDQWHLGQVAVGYAWGMSFVVLYGNESNSEHNGGPGYHSYLTWGSGICGAQNEREFLRGTCGGSNAIILSDTDALSGSTVPDLPKAEHNSSGTVEHEPRVLDGTHINAYYLGSTPEITAEDYNYSASFDFAYLAPDPIHSEHTHIGFKFGSNYSMLGGWDAATKKIVVAEHKLVDGIDDSKSYASTNEEYDFQPGEWHNLAMNIVGNEAKLYLDGKLVLDDINSSNRNASTTTDYQIIVYVIGEFVIDNYFVATGEYDFSTGTGGRVIADYTFDTDDEAFEKSDFKLQAIPNYFNAVKAECKRMNEDSRYDCNMKHAISADGKNVMKCEYCGYEEAIASTLGDVDMNGEIEVNDVSVLLRDIAGWTNNTYNSEAADVNADGVVNCLDAIKLLKYIAHWEGVTLG